MKEYQEFPRHLLPFIPEGKSVIFMEQKLNLINRMYSQITIQERYSHARIEDFPKELQKIVDPAKEIKSKLFIGKPGSGKTHLMWAMFKRYAEMSICQKGDATNCVVINVPNFLSILRSTYGRPNAPTERDILAQFTTGDYFFIDDLGAEKTTDWTISTLYLLFDSLYVHNKTVFISSNLSLKEIANKLEDRIASRIKGLCNIIKLSGTDKRCL